MAERREEPHGEDEGDGSRALARCDSEWQPIASATERIASHRLPCSRRCSRPTAPRFFASSLLGKLRRRHLTPTSQGLESPSNMARFTTNRRKRRLTAAASFIPMTVGSAVWDNPIPR